MQSSRSVFDDDDDGSGGRGVPLPSRPPESYAAQMARLFQRASKSMASKKRTAEDYGDSVDKDDDASNEGGSELDRYDLEDGWMEGDDDGADEEEDSSAWSCDDDSESDADDRPIKSRRRTRQKTDWPLSGRIDGAVFGAGVPTPAPMPHASAAVSRDAKSAEQRQEVRSRVMSWDPKQAQIMLYNWSIDEEGADRLQRMRKLGSSQLFRRPVQNGENSEVFDWPDATDALDVNALQRQIETMSMEDSRRPQATEIIGNLCAQELESMGTHCRLCGWMTSDSRKRSASRSAAESLRAVCDVGDASTADDAALDAQRFAELGITAPSDDAEAIDEYVFAGIARIVCDSLPLNNPIDCCILPALFWLFNAYIPSGGAVPLILPGEIYRHFFDARSRCVMDPRFTIAIGLRQGFEIAALARESMVVHNAVTGSKKVDPTQAKVWNDTYKTIMMLYNADPKKMLFNAPGFVVQNQGVLGPVDARKRSRKFG